MRRVSRCSVAVLVVAAVVPVATGTARSGGGAQDPAAVCTPSPGWGTVHQELVPRVLALVNAHRATLGLPALTLSAKLTAAALWKARHMAAYGYLSVGDPAPPVSRPFTDRLSACGYSGLIAGENLARGYADAEGVLGEWLRSPDLRATIENQAFTITGIAAAADAGGQLYWVEDFGAAGAPPSPPARRCRVPSVVGRTLSAAARALEAARCSLGRVSLVRSRRVRRGRVVAQSPRAGRTLALRGRVDLAVSTGPVR